MATENQGQYYLDVWRGVAYFYVPLCLIVAVLLMAGGVPMTLEGVLPQTTINRDQTVTASKVVAATPDAVAAAPPGAVPEKPVENEAAAESPKGSEAAQSAPAAQSSSRNKKNRVTSTSSPRQGSMRVRMLGITSDGRLIYRLPSGRTRIVAPDSDENQFVPRRHRRAYIQRDQIFAPPPQPGSDYFPYD